MMVCTKCKEKFTGEEISELRAMHEPMSMHPFMCPDCYDRFMRQDLEDQFSELTEGGDATMQEKL